MYFLRCILTFWWKCVGGREATYIWNTFYWPAHHQQHEKWSCLGLISKHHSRTTPKHTAHQSQRQRLCYEKHVEKLTLASHLENIGNNRQTAKSLCQLSSQNSGYERKKNTSMVLILLYKQKRKPLVTMFSRKLQPQYRQWVFSLLESYHKGNLTKVTMS